MTDVTEATWQDCLQVEQTKMLRGKATNFLVFLAVLAVASDAAVSQGELNLDPSVHIVLLHTEHVRHAARASPEVAPIFVVCDVSELRIYMSC